MSALALATITAPADDATDDVPPPFGLPRHPPVARVRRRPGAPGASSPGTPPPASPEPIATPSEDDNNPRTARLREAYEMWLSGKSKAEIARHFGKSTRIIFEWIEITKKRQGTAFLNKPRADHAAEIDIKIARQYALWMDLLSQAREAEDVALQMKVASRIDLHISHHAQFLARAGVFDGAVEPTASLQDKYGPGSGYKGGIPDSVLREMPNLWRIKAFNEYVQAAGLMGDKLPDIDWDEFDRLVQREINPIGEQSDPVF